MKKGCLAGIFESGAGIGAEDLPGLLPGIRGLCKAVFTVASGWEKPGTARLIPSTRRAARKALLQAVVETIRTCHVVTVLESFQEY